MLIRSEVPQWLRNWRPGDPTPVDDFMESNLVYYPGSGTDGQPVAFFGGRHLAHCFLYVDYGVSRNTWERELDASGHPFLGYRSLARLEVGRRELSHRDWKPHVQPAGAPSAPLVSVTPFAFLEVLERLPAFGNDHGPSRVAILFLCADGVATYDALFCQQDSGRPPLVLVIQDHGFGGGYTPFGREGELHALAREQNRFPDFLWVAENSAAWTGYSPVDGMSAGNGGARQHVRRLWKRD